MKINVIFMPYCNFAISGLSELVGIDQPVGERGVRSMDEHECKHLAADGEGKGDDEEHEEGHLGDEEEEDLLRG